MVFSANADFNWVDHIRFQQLFNRVLNRRAEEVIPEVFYFLEHFENLLNLILQALPITNYRLPFRSIYQPRQKQLGLIAPNLANNA